MTKDIDADVETGQGVIAEMRKVVAESREHGSTGTIFSSAVEKWANRLAALAERETSREDGDDGSFQPPKRHTHTDACYEADNVTTKCGHIGPRNLGPLKAHRECHDPECNGNKAYPRGVSGHGCSCRGREERLEAKVQELEAELERVKAERETPPEPDADGVPAVVVRRPFTEEEKKALDVLNVWGQECYDAGLEAKTDILLRQGELIETLKADLAEANAARVKWAEACDHMEDVLEAENAALRERVQELERKLHHESIEHTEAQKRIVELEAKLLELKRCDLQT